MSKDQVAFFMLDGTDFVIREIVKGKKKNRDYGDVFTERLCGALDVGALLIDESV